MGRLPSFGWRIPRFEAYQMVGCVEVHSQGPYRGVGALDRLLCDSYAMRHLTSCCCGCAGLEKPARPLEGTPQRKTLAVSYVISPSTSDGSMFTPSALPSFTARGMVIGAPGRTSRVPRPAILR